MSTACLARVQGAWSKANLDRCNGAHYSDFLVISIPLLDLSMVRSKVDVLAFIRIGRSPYGTCACDDSTVWARNH